MHGTKLCTHGAKTPMLGGIETKRNTRLHPDSIMGGVLSCHNGGVVSCPGPGSVLFEAEVSDYHVWRSNSAPSAQMPVGNMWVSNDPGDGSGSDSDSVHSSPESPRFTRTFSEAGQFLISFLFWLVLRPRGCTRGLFRSLRSRGSIRCRGRYGQIHWHEVADSHMPAGA